MIAGALSPGLRAIGRDAAVSYGLACAGGGGASVFIEDGIEIRNISGMSKTDVHQALEIVAEHDADELLALAADGCGL